MALARTSKLVQEARDQRRLVLAFNAITLEHAAAIITAAQRTKRDVIVQVSHNAIRYHEGAVRPLAAAIRELAQDAPVQIALHADHIEDADLIPALADAGFSSVMFDAAQLPYAHNLAATAAARELAHGLGLWLEAELGFVGGKAGVAVSAHVKGTRTDPDEARAFVDETGVDALAVAVGTSHGMTEQSADIDIALIERLHHTVPAPLVLHGSSGVRWEDLRAAAQAGMTKVNVGTLLNREFTVALQRSMGSSVDPRGYLSAGRQAMTDCVEELIQHVA